MSNLIVKFARQRDSGVGAYATHGAGMTGRHPGSTAGRLRTDAMCTTSCAADTRHRGDASSSLAPIRRRARIKSFAAEFDPQPFHLDESTANETFFKGLAASGWHTAAITMRLLVDGELKPAGGIIGASFDEMRWPKPVRPGDELRVESEILEVRPSKSRPDQGVIKVRTTTLNQNGEPVQVFVGNLIVLRRPSDDSRACGR
jgi:acyl dehydratase